MPRPAISPHSLALACLAALLNCGDATGPRQEAQLGVYGLERADGQPLPAPIQVTPACMILVDSGYVWLRDSTTFQLEYTGIAACQPPDSGSGARWHAFYTGPVVLTPDKILFRLPDLTHLGLDSLRFVGYVRPGDRIRARVPQLPGASGPPVDLQFRYNAALPPPTLVRLRWSAGAVPNAW